MARTDVNGVVGQAGREAGRMARSAVRNPWVERLARFGYAARGAVYALVGILALQAAAGTGGQTTGTEGAIQEIGAESRGLLALIAVGLFGYALWRVIQAVLDPEDKGTDAKGLAQRGAMLLSGLIYGGLAMAAVRLVTGGAASGSGGGDQGAQSWTAGLLAKPFGAALVGLAGAAVIAYGLSQLKRGYTKQFRDKLKLGEMNAMEETWATRTGQLGLIARGVVLVLIGSFLIQAAMQSDPTEARGLGGALDSLAAQPYGPWLLGLTALGLVAYGAYSFLEARYRRIVF